MLVDVVLCIGLVDKGAELVIKFRVQISQKSLAALKRAYNFKMLLCYIRKPCSIVGNPSETPKKTKKQHICKFFTWE